MRGRLFLGKIGACASLACLAVTAVRAQPNLTPFTPTGWSSPLVVSDRSGTNTSNGNLTSDDTVYVDWAVANTGATSTGGAFFVSLYLNNQLETTWTVAALDPNFFTFVEDYSLGTLARIMQEP